MKIPFLPLYIFTSKRLNKFARAARERQENDNKIIVELLRQNNLLLGSAEYLLRKTKKSIKGNIAFARGMDIARNQQRQLKS